MGKTYLLTRPEHDDTTHYLSSWCQATIGLAQEKGIKVLDLHREKANASEIENRINQFSPDLVVLNGHGSENAVMGHRNQPLIQAGKNENLLSSRVVYAISCKSAKSLGPTSVQAGAINYTGYDDDFIFVYEPRNAARPLHDETARLFLEPSKIFVDSLLKGNTVDESRKRAANLLRKNMLKSLSGAGKDTNVARFLWWDLKHFVSHGDMNATI